MIRRRTLLLGALAGAGSLAGCGNDSDTTASAPAGASASSSASEAIDQVTVTGAFGAEPKVTFPTPLAVTAPAAKIVSKGSGAKITAGNLLAMHTEYVGAKDATVLQSAWKGAPSPFLAVDEKTNGKETAAFLESATVGSRIAMLGQVTDSQGQAVPIVQISDILRVSPTRASGTAQSIPTGMPAFTLAKNGAPHLSGTPTMKAPGTTKTATTIRGTGAKTTKGQRLAMQYTGWTLEDGKQFDSSWDRGVPFDFTLGAGEVIAGWDRSLLGVRIGSQVLMVIPAAEAYKDQGELANKTLVFVADVLDATSAAHA